MKNFRETLVKLYHFSNSWIGTIVIVLFVIFFFAQAFVVPTGSMKNTIHEGDHFIVKKFVYGIPIPHIPFAEVPILPDFDGDGHLFAGAKPERGDIVVFRYPVEPKMYYVKRCVAVGGDQVMLRGDSLFVLPREGNDYARQNYPKEQLVAFGDELWVKDPYLAEHKGIHYDRALREMGASLPVETRIYGPTTVPEGKFFMMGDNRDHSNDSRFWGSVGYEYIVGQPWFSYFSWEPRSYKEMAEKSVFGAENTELKAICGELDVMSGDCRKLWERNRYKVRWDRIGKSMRGLEDSI
jgi:signal peptidase I